MTRTLKRAAALLLLSTSILGADAAETIRHYLSGTGSDKTVEWDFFCSEGMNSGKWTKIAVPSCWELQGFGNYNYGHDPFEERVNEHGLYRYKFTLPKEWRGNAVRIVFEGVMTDAEVKINGKKAGERHQGAFYEFKFDVEHLLKFGAENTLEVRVDKASSNESINHAERKADFWIFGGVYRPVYLEVMPREHIERVAIDAAASGAIKAEIFTNSKQAKGVEIELQDLTGNKLASLSPTKCERLNDRWSLEAQAQNIKQWNSEKPNLYQLKISLNNSKGEPLHTLTQRIGFRTIEVLDGDGVYVNGERVKFKGVNRHTFHPETGRTTNRSVSLQHIEMIKDMNMNAVRMSHYPPEVHFLDLCDSLGLFVIDEVCTWHTPKLDTEVGRKIVRETVTRDVNHPSILFWANGNETGWNTELDGDYAIYDIQKRNVIHPWNVLGKINNLHYPLYSGAISDSRAQDKILFHTEFLHGCYDGGHGAGLEDFWNIHWNNPLGAGGFLWCFADEGVVRKDKGGIIDTNGNMAADGIVGSYLEKEASYFTIKEIWSPIYIEDRYIRDDFTGLFRIENRYHFTNLDECKLEAKWMKFTSPDGNTSIVASKSNVKLPALKPYEKGKFTVAKPTNWREMDALHLTAHDPHGKEIFTWSYPVKSPERLNKELIKLPKSGEVKSTQSEATITATAKGMEFIFDKTSGEIKSIKRDGKLIPLSGLKILTETKVVKDKLEKLITKRLDGAMEYTFVLEPSLQKNQWVTEKIYSSDTIKWTVYADGKLDLSVTLKSMKVVKGYKGITFDYPEENITGMKWLGDGPYRVWRNRMRGTQFGVWASDYNDTVTAEYTDGKLIYPEFKGFFSNFYWGYIYGKNDSSFKLYCHTPFVYIRLFTPKISEGFRRGKAITDAMPAGDISFVMNAPAMATKFQDPAQTGPHGSVENYYGNFDEPIVIDLTFDFR
ncbi:MAG: glycoside hydrolase family 2 TIM barrel-domain containing protein [Rikenellaceae bacterium]